MNDEKSKSAAITTGAGDSGDTGSRRSWHKPTVTRIDIKRTKNEPGSGGDGVGTHTT